VRTHLAVSFTAAAVLALLLWLAIGRPAYLGPCLIAWLVGVTVTTFFYYGYDKRQARVGGRRVPELVLHLLAALGGSAGAYAGMRVFRHKTVKGRFRLLFWFIVAAQAALLAWAVRSAFRSGGG
jgi:uncharacterized membrane protein YsdA (DUF1294 family)